MAKFLHSPSQLRVYPMAHNESAFPAYSFGVESFFAKWALAFAPCYKLDIDTGGIGLVMLLAGKYKKSAKAMDGFDTILAA